MKFGSMAAT